MKSVLKAWLLGALLAALTLLLNALASQIYRAGHRAGASEIQGLWNEHQAIQADQHAADLQTLKARHDALQERLAAEEVTHQEEKDRAQSQNDYFVAGVLSGRIRLSVPTKTAAAPTVRNTDAALGAAPAGQPTQARAELDPAAAADLVAITHDGDNAIRDLNACIERYTTVRTSINAPFALTDVQGQ